MSQVSKLTRDEYESAEDASCICCGHASRYGGFYTTTVDLALCADCLTRSDFRGLGILLGDALVDRYLRGHPIDKVAPSESVRSILLRLESAIYRAVADGLHREFAKK